MLPTLTNKIDPLVEILEIGDEDDMIEFVVENVHLSVAMAWRVFMMCEIPIFAIDKVVIEENTSRMMNNMLSHRLGLFPIWSESSENFKNSRECKCKDDCCEDCAVQLNLDVECRDNIIFDNIKGILSARSQNMVSQHVTSFHLHSENSSIAPLKLNLSQDSSGREYGSNILLMKLTNNQRVKLKAYAKLGIAREHVKWMPTVGITVLPYNLTVKNENNTRTRNSDDDIIYKKLKIKFESTGALKATSIALKGIQLMRLRLVNLFNEVVKLEATSLPLLTQ